LSSYCPHSEQIGESRPPETRDKERNTNLKKEKFQFTLYIFMGMETDTKTKWDGLFLLVLVLVLAIIKDESDGSIPACTILVFCINEDHLFSDNSRGKELYSNKVIQKQKLSWPNFHLEYKSKITELNEIYLANHHNDVGGSLCFWTHVPPST
jgi:hypothetical protein